MTKNEVYKQVYDLSVRGRFNHQKWSFLRFKGVCDTRFEDDNCNHIILEILMPDGWWHMVIHRLRIHDDVIWDYYIPDTKDEENMLRREFEREIASGEVIIRATEFD